MDIDILSMLTKLAEWAGWSVVAIVTILVCGMAMWIKDQKFESMNQRIETLKGENEWLKTQLDDAKNFTPSALVERLASQHKVLTDELETLYADFKVNEKRIKKAEFEKEQVATELNNIVSSLFSSIESTCIYNCLYCSQPKVVNKPTNKVEISLTRDGKRFILDIESKCQNCGHKTMSVQKVST